MKRRAEPDEPPFQFIEIDAAEAARYPTALRDIHAQRLDGIIVRGVLGAETLATVVDRLERADPPLRRSVFPGHEDAATSPHVLGHAIVSCQPDLSDYLAEAPLYRGRPSGTSRAARRRVAPGRAGPYAPVT